jgi:ABC-type sulfate transport system permease subunit
MPQSLPGILFALTTFVITFIVARTLAKWFRKRKAQREEQAAHVGASRQVRRAKERKKRGG